MKQLLLLLLLVVMFGTASAQSEEVNVVIHKVKPGETVRLISRKYLVSPSDIYRLNEFAVDGISEGMELQIPVKEGQTTQHQKATAAVEKHPESPDNRQVNVADPDEVEAIMDELEGKEAENHHVDKDQSTSNFPVTLHHTVAPGETLSALSRKYHVTVAAIQAGNVKALEHGLKAGQVLLIPGSENPSAQPNVTTEVEILGGIEHIVQPKETLYSIAKKYSVSVDEITKQNEKLLAHGLQAGQVIKIKPNN